MPEHPLVTCCSHWVLVCVLLTVLRAPSLPLQLPVMMPSTVGAKVAPNPILWGPASVHGLDCHRPHSYDDCTQASPNAPMTQLKVLPILVGIWGKPEILHLTGSLVS